jgi:type I protein arginine methyltransferase
MEVVYKKKSPSQESKAPKEIKVTKATEKGFEIENCMADFKVEGQETFEHDTDYYFDSYAHFSIHEEMLKDRVQPPKSSNF